MNQGFLVALHHQGEVFVVETVIADGLTAVLRLEYKVGSQRQPERAVDNFIPIVSAENAGCDTADTVISLCTGLNLQGFCGRIAERKRLEMCIGKCGAVKWIAARMIPVVAFLQCAFDTVTGTVS